MAFGTLGDLEGLLATEEMERCVARRWLAFGLGRDAEAADLRAMDGAMAHLRTGTGEMDLHELIGQVALSEAFRSRRVPSTP